MNHHTVALAAVAFAMWYAGAAQQNGGAYLLAFLTGSIVLLSWLYAKANLRALGVEAGAVARAEEGSIFALPLNVSVGEGALPCGLEITAAGAIEAITLDNLDPERPSHVRLRLKGIASGRQPLPNIIVRSRYPLGFFTAERTFEISSPQLIHPKPAGSLVLPSVTDDSGRSASSHTAKQHGQTGAGDDFAGVREWQPGDSLRQVDWKAVARDRPMMVKLWTGETKGVVWLDWAACPLPEDERPAQFAQWMVEAEQRGLHWGMRLPGKVMEPNGGNEHRMRCLDELARLQPRAPESANAKQTRSTTKLPTTEYSPVSPHLPTGLLATAMMMAGLPMIGNVPTGGVIMFFLCIAHLWWRKQRHLPVLGYWTRLVLVVISAAACFAQRHSSGPVEFGVGVLLAVLGGKTLESRNAHDYQVVATLGWFLCLCDIILDQSLSQCLYVLLVFALIAFAMVSMRRGRSGIKAPIRTALSLLVQSVPLVLLLFPLFPRLPPNLVLNLSRSFGHRTGISSNLDPGSVAEIALTPGRAFWASFPDGNPPESGELYWRCLVLWQCEGLKWRHGSVPFAKNADSQNDVPAIERRTPEIHQRITLDPHGGHWLPALDTPNHVMSHPNEHHIVINDGVLASDTEVTSVRRYDVGSSRRLNPVELPDFIRRVATQVPENLSPAVLDLAFSFQAKGETDQEIAKAALNYFRNHDFRYTLTPEKYGDRALDEFLFKRRLGFCEHFAASFATLMRACDVPARIVVGYLGGEYSTRWGHYTVHQPDAHAWCELWYEGKGWTRVDPTAALAPGRIGVDLRTYLEGGMDSTFAHNQNTWWGRAITETQLMWDNINYQWYTRVVQFDEDDQDSLYNTLIRLAHGTTTLVLFGLLLPSAPLLFLWFWLNRKRRHADPVVRSWQSFCAKLAKAGVERHANEAPSSYTARAAKALPQAANQIAAIGELYVQYRYGSDGLITKDLQRAVRAFGLRKR